VVGHRSFAAVESTRKFADLAELANLPCIGFRPVSVAENRPWLLQRGNEQHSFNVRNPVVSVSSIDALVDLVVAGVGIAAAPDYLISDHLRSGNVVELLDGYYGIGPEVHLCFSNRDLIPNRVRALIDALTDSIKPRLAKSWESIKFE
jgi:DNA-binding transcriptional LysR family regulator